MTYAHFRAPDEMDPDTDRTETRFVMRPNAIHCHIVDDWTAIVDYDDNTQCVHHLDRGCIILRTKHG